MTDTSRNIKSIEYMPKIYGMDSIICFFLIQEQADGRRAMMVSDHLDTIDCQTMISNKSTRHKTKLTTTDTFGEVWHQAGIK